MPDLYMDVDAALSEVPVNVMPLLDDSDFKTRETAIAYNESGMDLVWNFVTSAGAYTQTAVTPTTGGNYDWAHQGDGMYSIEIPASGGASINNDTEGYGWFTGVCDGVLPWRGPIIGFRDSDLNDKLLDSAWSATRGLAGTALPDAAADAAGGIPISDAGGLDLDTYLGRITANVATEAKQDTIDGIVDDILVDTGTTLPATLSTIEAKIDTIDGIVDDILVDTGTTIPALINGLNDFDPASDTVDVGKISGDATAADNLEAILDGTGAALTLKSSTQSPLHIEATGGTYSGMRVIGYDTGHGMEIESGSGASGDAIHADCQSSDGHGLYAEGGGASSGIEAHGGSGGGNGFYAEGQGTGLGMKVKGGATNGHGFEAHGQGTGHGANFRSGTGATGDGIHSASEATDGQGMFLQGAGVESGLDCRGGATGNGIYAQGGATSGDGMKLYGGPDSDGLNSIAQGTGHGIQGVAEGSGRDFHADEIGARFTLDGVSNAGILGVLKKVVDDNNGGTYDATTDSLAAIRARGDVAWITGSGTGATVLTSGTAQGGTSSTLTLAAGESSVADYYKGERLVTTGGTGAGQSRLIKDYDESTKVATVLPDWRTTPDNTTTYEIQACDSDMAAIIEEPLDGNNATLKLAQLDIQNSAGSAIIASSTGGNGKGIEVSGNGTGSGLDITSGNSTGAYGLKIYSTQSHALYIENAGSAGAAYLLGGSGASGLYVNGQGSAPGAQIVAGSGGGHGISISGKGTGHGIYTIAETTGSGIFSLGGGSSGAGIYGAATGGNSNGMTLSANGTGKDISADEIGVPTDLGDGASLADMLTAMAGKTASAASYNRTYDSQEAIRDLNETISASATATYNVVGPMKIHSGTSQSGGSSTTIKLDSGASSDDDKYNGMLIVINDESVENESRLITAYDGTTKIATVDRAWEIADPDTKDFIIYYDGTVNANEVASTVDANIIQISGDSGAADNLELDYDGTGYNKANSTIGTCTVNTDMRGTDNAALASVCTEARLSELDAANIPTDLSNIETKIDIIDTNVDAILVDTGTTIPGLIAALNNLSAAEVNAEVVDVMNVDTWSEESSGAPPASPSIINMLMYRYMTWRNKNTTDSSENTIYNDAGTAIAKAAVSDTGSLFTKDEYTSP